MARDSLPNSNTYTEQQTNPSSRSRETAADRNVSNNSKTSSRKDVSFPGAKKNPEVRPGGRWNPPYCKSRHKVAVIVPYRDREQHLRIFLKHMHPVLKRQQLDYGIYIVEQYGEPKFNRAMLFNIGFKEALKEYDYDCFIFHDVDLIPEDDRNIYSCPDTPKHMSVAVDEMNYKLPYDGIFGGICALSTVHFQRVNGFSNSFWGWGGEDDDMANRLTAHSLYVMRPPAEIARYKMIPHRKAKPSPDRIQKLKTGRDRYGTDGLNSLEYELLALSHQPLFTYIAAKLERTADPTEESWIPSWLFTNSAKSFVDMWKKNWAELKRKPLDNDTISRYQKNWKERKPNKFKPYGGDRKSRYVVSNTTREEDIRNFIRRDGTFATTTQSQTKRLGHAARITNQQQAPSYRGNVQTNRLSQNSTMQQADQTLYKTPVLDTIGKSQIPQTRMHAYRGPNGTLDRKGKDKVRILDTVTEADVFAREMPSTSTPYLNRDGGRHRLSATYDPLLTESRFLRDVMEARRIYPQETSQTLGERVKSKASHPGISGMTEAPAHY
ncbi:lactose synthase [Branchiostoma belcheri]|nr:lactose synthase [Branchiostoma belcheri]